MNNERNFPIKRKTRVDFIHNEVSLGERDGEVIVKLRAKIQLEKFDLTEFGWIWQKRFPFVSKNGVFTVVGRAVCGNEPFNFEKGKNIAETRAQKKAYNIAYRIYEMVINELENQIKWFKFVKTNCFECVKNAELHIIDLDNHE